MRVLVGCEKSKIVSNAFSKRGCHAVSCDMQPAETPGNHFCHHVFDVVAMGWDLIIMHPPCTALAVSGNRWYGHGKKWNGARSVAKRWTENLWMACKNTCEFVAFENPVGVLSETKMGKATQYIQPWQFGHGETKKTGLWLHNLPPLEATDVVDGREQRIWKMPPSKTRRDERSRFYEGIAEAMADQWIKYIAR